MDLPLYYWLSIPLRMKRDDGSIRGNGNPVAFNSFEDETGYNRTTLEFIFVKLSIPLRMKHNLAIRSRSPQRICLSIPLRMKHSQTHSILYSQIPFNSFEDETCVLSGIHHGEWTIIFQFLWGWNAGFGRLWHYSPIQLSIPLRMKHGSPWPGGPQSSQPSFNSFEDETR